MSNRNIGIVCNLLVMVEYKINLQNLSGTENQVLSIFPADPVCVPGLCLRYPRSSGDIQGEGNPRADRAGVRHVVSLHHQSAAVCSHLHFCGGHQESPQCS